jgi:hypothetical protein
VKTTRPRFFHMFSLIFVVSLVACGDATGPSLSELQGRVELPAPQDNRITIWYEDGDWFMSMPVLAPVGVDPDLGVRVEATPTSTTGWLAARLATYIKGACGSQTCQGEQYIRLTVAKDGIPGHDQADVVLFAARNTSQASRYRVSLANSPYGGTRGIIQLVRVVE